RRAGPEPALLLRRPHHPDRRPVLDRAGGVAVLQLRPQPHVVGRRQRRQSDQRGVADRLDQRPVSHRQPPATAGRMVTSSPSDSPVSSAPVKRTSSSLTYTLTNRCSEPSSVTSRPLRPGCFASRSSISEPSELPLASTCFSPPV